MAVKHVKRLTAEEYADRIEYLLGAASTELAFATIEAASAVVIEETLRRIQHAAQECALYIAETVDA